MKNLKYKIPEAVLKKRSRSLYLQDNNPIKIVKDLIVAYLLDLNPVFQIYENLPDVVSTSANFDDLLIEENHPSRSISDTYYIDDKSVLRTHMTAHLSNLLSRGCSNYLIVGDVYRKDEINRTHSNVFHQIDGLSEVPIELHPEEYLKDLLSNLTTKIFPNLKFRILPDNFPFVIDGMQIEIEDKETGTWMEILGGGTVHPDIIKRHCGENDKRLVAWGMGLERLAMLLFDIPDIRLFWTQDKRFLNQFKKDQFTSFKPFSILSNISRDISFWISDEKEIREVMSSDIEMHNNAIPNHSREASIQWCREKDFFEIVRNASNEDDIIDAVFLIDTFHHPILKRYSLCYRVSFAALPDCNNPSAFADVADETMARVCDACSTQLGVSLR